ncbi:MAG: hypothetical protein WC389_10510 [Lutibacter sp.]|jgi:hypothetical protein
MSEYQNIKRMLSYNRNKPDLSGKQVNKKLLIWRYKRAGLSKEDIQILTGDQK